MLSAGFRRHGRELLALAVVLLVSAFVNWHFAAKSFFVADDIHLFQDALHARFWDLDFLLGIHGDHFSPGRRATSVLIQRHAPLHYDLSLAWLLAAHLVSTVLVQRILRLLFGAHWWTLGVALAFGVSIVFTSILEWWSSAILIVPATTLGLASIHGYLWWWRTGKTAWLAWSGIALAVGVLFYEKATLAALYILLIRVFLLERDGGIRERLRVLTREWRVWLVYAVPVVGTLLAYALRDTGNAVPHLTARVVLDYFATAWGVGFVPSTFGIRLPIGGDPAFRRLVVDATELVVAGAVLVSVLRRRSAWVPWALLVFVFGLNATLVFPRLGYGAQVGYVLRYFSETLYFAAIVVPFAFADPCAREEVGRPLRVPRPWAAAAVGGLLATCCAFAWFSDRAFTRHWNGPIARAWFTNAQADMDRLHLTAEGTTVLDGGVPSEVIPFWLIPNRRPPINSLRAILPLIKSGVSFNRIAPRTYRALLDGHFERVRFQRATTVLDRRTCLGRGERRRTLEWVPREALINRDFYLVATYRSDPGGALLIQANRGLGYPPGRDMSLIPRPGTGRTLREIGGIPGGTPTVAGLKIGVTRGRRVCLSRLVVGSFEPVR